MSLTQQVKRAAQLLTAANAAFDADHARDPEYFDDRESYVEDYLADAMGDDEEGEPYDTDCIEDGHDNCNDWGTGEGQFHGRF